MMADDNRYMFACNVCGESCYRITGEQLTNLSAFHTAGHAAQQGTDRATVRLELLRRARIELGHYGSLLQSDYPPEWFGTELQTLCSEIDEELQRDG